MFTIAVAVHNHWWWNLGSEKLYNWNPIRQMSMNY